MPDVNNPPALIAQETSAWCFAAAERMVRRFYNIPDFSQYEIARRSVIGRTASDPELANKWGLALGLDLSLGRKEDHGRNDESEVVKLVRGEWGSFNYDDTKARFEINLTAKLIKQQIRADRIFVIGDARHYYIVYGYEGNGEAMHVRDPWPQGQGGQRQTVTLAEFNRWQVRIAMLFGP